MDKSPDERKLGKVMSQLWSRLQAHLREKGTLDDSLHTSAPDGARSSSAMRTTRSTRSWSSRQCRPTTA
eukprot:4487895-Heterocapsa_arctica.AAC.1